MEERVRTVATRVLPDWGKQARLEQGTPVFSSPRFHVFRFPVVDADASAPATVIAKMASSSAGEPYDPERAESGPAWRLLNDWAGLQFVGQIAAEAGVESPTPRLLAGDRETGLILIEDLGDISSLADLFWDSDAPTTESALIEMARAQGRLHALTLGKQADFEGLRRTLGNYPSRTPEADGGYSRLARVFQETTSALEIPPVPGTEQDLRTLCGAFAVTGPFWTYCHNDSCPTNCLPLDGSVRLIDFEAGGYGHALRDTVYGRLPFPPCFEGHRLPASAAPRMEAAYRTELQAACPEAGDDATFFPALVAACAWWNLTLFQPGMAPLADLLRSDRDYGSSTARRRTLVRLESFVRTTEEFHHLEALGASFAAVLHTLKRLWAQEADDLPIYPAFLRDASSSV
jgi:hypothetical protein